MDTVLEFLLGVGQASFTLLAHMAPYLLLGVVVAGALHVLLPMAAVARYLGRPGLGSVLRASAVGVPLPLCSCSVVPVAASLKRSGASKAAVVSFLVTTPTSGVDSILATFSLLGWLFAAARVVASFLIGLLAGAAAGVLGEPDTAEAGEAPALRVAPGGSLGARSLAALRYGFDELLGGFARPLSLGILLAGLISYLLPASLLEAYVGDGVLAYAMMLVIGIPLYVCASGSIPLAAALMAKGLSPGAALVFLLTGPATNAATLSVLKDLLGKRTLLLYLGLLAAGSVAAGLATDALFGAFPGLLPDFAAAHAHGMGGLSLLQILSGLGLAALTLAHLGRQLRDWLRRRRSAAGQNVQEALQLRVPDMTCGNCARTIRSALEGLPGLSSVEADPETKLVSLRPATPELSLRAQERIRKAGFSPEPLTRTLVLQVPDMTCGNCARSIEGAVSELPELCSVDADPSSKEVTLKLSGAAGSAPAIAAIAAAGFHPNVAELRDPEPEPAGSGQARPTQP